MKIGKALVMASLLGTVNCQKNIITSPPASEAPSSRVQVSASGDIVVLGEESPTSTEFNVKNATLLELAERNAIDPDKSVCDGVQLIEAAVEDITTGLGEGGATRLVPPLNRSLQWSIGGESLNINSNSDGSALIETLNINGDSLHAFSGTLDRINIRSFWMSERSPSDNGCQEGLINITFRDRENQETGPSINTIVLDLEICPDGVSLSFPQEISYHAFNHLHLLPYDEFISAYQEKHPQMDEESNNDYSMRCHKAYIEEAYLNGFLAEPQALDWAPEANECTEETTNLGNAFRELMEKTSGVYPGAKRMLREKRTEQLILQAAEDRLSECAQNHPDQTWLNRKVGATIGSVVRFESGCTGFRYGEPEEGLIATAGHCIVNEDWRICSKNDSCTLKQGPIGIYQVTEVTNGTITGMEYTEGRAIYAGGLDVGFVLLEPEAHDSLPLQANPDSPQVYIPTTRPIAKGREYDNFHIPPENVFNIAQAHGFTWTTDVGEYASDRYESFEDPSNQYTLYGPIIHFPENCNFARGSSGSPILSADGTVLSVVTYFDTLLKSVEGGKVIGTTSIHWFDEQLDALRAKEALELRRSKLFSE